MLTREIPFKGLEGLQVAWLVVEKNEVRLHMFTHSVSLGIIMMIPDSPGIERSLHPQANTLGILLVPLVLR